MGRINTFKEFNRINENSQEETKNQKKSEIEKEKIEKSKKYSRKKSLNEGAPEDIPMSQDHMINLLTDKSPQIKAAMIDSALNRVYIYEGGGDRIEKMLNGYSYNDLTNILTNELKVDKFNYRSLVKLPEITLNAMVEILADLIPKIMKIFIGSDERLVNSVVDR